MLSKHSLLFMLAGALLTLGMASAIDVLGTEFMNQSKKVKAQPCCYPDAFERVYGLYIGYHDNQANISGMQINIDTISSDATAMKLAYNKLVSDTPGGPYLNTKVIYDFANHLYYLIYPNINCTYNTLVGDFQKTCVPADAKLVGSYYLGVDDQTVDVQSWMYSTGNQTIVMGVDAKYCAPLSYFSSGLVDSYGYMATGGSSNMTLGIKDPSVFDPPQGCQPVTRDHAAAPNHVTKFLEAIFVQ